MRTKRILSIALTLAVLLGLLPGMRLTASAAGETAEITPTNTSGTMTITLTIKAAQTITASDVTATYGDTDKSVSATTDGDGAISYAVKDGSENYIEVAADGKLTIKAVPPTDGKAYVIVTAAETDDYAETTKEVTVTISKANPTAPTGLTATYGQTLANVTLPDGWTWADSTQSVGNVVDPAATFKANFAGDDNHNAASNVDVTVTVSKANAVAATVTANSRTYDGTEKPLVTVTGEATGGTMQYALGTANEATEPYTTSIPAGTAAETYYVWYKVVGDGNHNDYTATAPATVTIAKANASAAAPTALNLTYTGQEQALVVAGSTNDGEMQYSLDGVSYSATIPTGTEAKTYSVWYKVVGDKNHNDTAPAKIEVKINPADANPTVPTADTLAYTGKPQALVTGGSVTGGELQYALGEDDENAPQDGWSTTVPTGTDAGDYFVWYRIKGDANHNDVAPECIPVSIAKAAIAPTVSLTGWTYGEDANAPSVEGNPGNGEVTYAYSDSADGTFTATVPSDAGTWFVRAVVAETDNYQGATTQPLSFAIAKASIMPTVSLTGWTYGEDPNAPSVEGNPGNGEVTYTYSDAADGTFTATVPGDAGTWYVKADVAETANYGGATSAAASFAIAKAAIAPTVSLTGWTYSEDPNAPSVDGNTGNGEVTYAYAAKGGSDYSAAVPTAAGDYTVKATIAATDNYNGGEATADFTIAKAAIAPTVSLTGWTYGQTANAPSVEDNPGNGEVTYAYSDAADGTYTATVPSDAGTWYVMADVAETDNYLGAATEPLSFAIAKAAITITADNKSGVYGADIAALTWKVSGSYVAGDELGISAATTASKTSSVGSYPITVAWNGNANYTATLVNGQYAITPKAITVTADDKTKIIGEADPELTYAVEGLVKGDEMTGSLTREAGEDVGSYAILQGTLSAGDNYSMRFTGAVLTITAKPVPPVSPGYTVLAMMRPAGKTSLKLSWSKVKGAEGYDVFFKRCGAGDYPLVATVKASAARSYTVKGLKKSTSYKAYVKAWKKVGGEKTYIGNASPTVHAITGGYSKTRTDAKKVTVKSPRVTLAVGKTSAIKASVKGIMPDRTLVTHAKALRYYSSNRSVAAVSSSGVIKARSAGACTIYVIANNGVRASVKVTVADAPTNIAFKKSSYSVKVGKTLKLAGQIKLTPAGATTVYTWSSADTDIATVSAKGVVTAIKKGKTVITVTTANGKKAKATIKVK